MDNDALYRIAHAQDGLFSRTQAAACGYSPYQVRRRLAAGVWRQALGSVLVLPGVTITTAVRDRAALMAINGSVLAGPAAARRWGMRMPDQRPCVLVRPSNHPRIRGVIVIRDRLAPDDRRDVGGLPVTSAGRTLVDCARLLSDDAAVDLIDRALREGTVSFDELCARVRERVGRSGTPRLVRLIKIMGSGARSQAERRAMALLRRSRIGGWLANAPIYDAAGLIGVGDIVFEAYRLVLEIDGWAYHSAREDFERDRARQNRLVAAGWTVLRFTWRDLTQRPDHVVRTVRAMIARAR